MGAGGDGAEEEGKGSSLGGKQLGGKQLGPKKVAGRDKTSLSVHCLPTPCHGLPVFPLSYSPTLPHTPPYTSIRPMASPASHPTLRSTVSKGLFSLLPPPHTSPHFLHTFSTPLAGP